MRLEHDNLILLASVGFGDFAGCVDTRTGAHHAVDDQGTCWTGYELVPGVPASKLDRATAELVGSLLARFHAAAHAALARLPVGVGSRLNRLPEAFQRVRTICERGALIANRLLRVLEEHVVAVTNPGWCGPKVMIHGDFVLENILIADRPRLVDFEFSRYDLRSLEFGALAAPLRNGQGEFELAPAAFREALFATYQDEIPPSLAFTYDELRSLHRASAAHWIFVCDDLARGSNLYLPAAVRVLGAVAQSLAQHAGDSTKL